jgi:ParB family chromosome partitioning protein
MESMMPEKMTDLGDPCAASPDETRTVCPKAPGDHRLLELDPDSILPGAFDDRFDPEFASLSSLAESIRTLGQKVPILVRPLPGTPVQYRIIAGRRRVMACKMAGILVRAEIHDLDPRDSLLVQAAENIAREDLTYIERAKFAARMVDEVGIRPRDIEVAFSCGKTDRSRYLKIGRAIPDDFLDFIGTAPGVGRPRWEKLAEALTDKGAGERVRKMMRTAGRQQNAIRTSDERFDAILKAATPKPQRPSRSPQKKSSGDVWPSEDRPLGRISRDAHSVHLSLSREDHPDLSDWVSENPEKVAELLLNAYARETPKGAEDDMLAAANTVGLE